MSCVRFVSVALETSKRRVLKMKIFFALTLLIYAYHCEAIEVECDFFDYAFMHYTCGVKNPVLITLKDDRTITSMKMKRQHWIRRSDESVTGFQAYGTVVKFMPRGILKFFKNIEFIGIVDAGLEEVTKEDLKDFGANLKILDLSGNEIEVIHADLFEFNPNLEMIHFEKNQIKQIGDGTFNGLKELSYLRLNLNPCTAEAGVGDAWNRRVEVLKVIKNVEPICKDLSFV